MNNNLRSNYCRIEYYKTKQFPNELFPICYFFDGSVSLSLVAFCNMQLKVGSGSLKALEKTSRVVARIYHFYQTQKEQNPHWESKSEAVFIDYFSSRLHGTITPNGDSTGLLYEKVLYNTAKAEIRDFNRFHNFCRRFMGVLSSDDYIGDLSKRYSGKQKASKFNLLAHLDLSFKNSSVTCSSEYWQMPLRNSHKNDQSSFQSTKYKAFPHAKILDFISSQKNQNIKAAMLLQAFTGIRGSEALHVLITDIVPNAQRSIEVIVSHPINGMTFDPISKRSVKRKDLFERFASQHKEKSGLSKVDLEFLNNLRPRIDIPNKYNLDWKGMYLPHVDYSTEYGYTLDWIDDFAKKEFERLLPYLKKQRRRGHPYLLITESTGMPLTISNYTMTFRRHSETTCGLAYGPHSLRHFCGEYCANALDFSVEQTKSVMRHSSPNSTQLYYRKTKQKVRSELKQIHGVGLGKDNAWKQTQQKIRELWG